VTASAPWQSPPPRQAPPPEAPATSGHLFIPKFIWRKSLLANPNVQHQRFAHAQDVPDLSEMGPDDIFPVTESIRYRVVPWMALTFLWTIVVFPYALARFGPSWPVWFMLLLSGYLLYRTWYAHVRRLVNPLAVELAGVTLVRDGVYKPTGPFVQAQDFVESTPSYLRVRFLTWFFKWTNLGKFEIVTGEKQANILMKGVAYPEVIVAKLLKPLQIAGEEAAKAGARAQAATSEKMDLVLEEMVGLRTDIVELTHVVRQIATAQSAGLSDLTGLLREWLYRTAPRPQPGPDDRPPAN
jgi:hypothetical protein